MKKRFFISMDEELYHEIEKIMIPQKLVSARMEVQIFLVELAKAYIKKQKEKQHGI